MYLKNSPVCHDIKTVGHNDYNIPAIDNEITDYSLPAFSPLGLITQFCCWGHPWLDLEKGPDGISKSFAHTWCKNSCGFLRTRQACLILYHLRKQVSTITCSKLENQTSVCTSESNHGVYTYGLSAVLKGCSVCTTRGDAGQVC